VEGAAVKQNVSAPVAAIVLGLAILVSIVVFSRPRAGGPEQAPFVLPSAPPVDENEMRILHQGLAPLGIACVMMPLASDRFKGARVALVAPGSPADRGGMKAGDLVTAFNDIKVSSPYSILAALLRADPKKPNAVVVVRAGKEEKLVITGLMPPPQEARG
jgi:membrane-associated protease RseP (regulator of RpoE activity)